MDIESDWKNRDQRVVRKDTAEEIDESTRIRRLKFEGQKIRPTKQKEKEEEEGRRQMVGEA